MLPLHDAAKRGNLEQVSDLLNTSKGNTDMLDSNGYSALHTATLSGHPQVVGFLLDHGATVNMATPTGRTTLHFACEYGHITPEAYQRIAQLLLDHNADVNR